MSDKPDVFQFLSDVRHQKSMIFVPIDQSGTEAGPPELVIPAPGGPSLD